MPEPLPSIYAYNNFRLFLRDFQLAKRANDRLFTKSGICRKLGIPNSRSYYNDVLNGKHVTPTYIERFVRLFEFNSEEAKFFRVLVKFNQAEGTQERELYFEQLIALNKTPKRELSRDLYEYYREWYNGAVRAALETVDFKDDCSLLTKKIIPPITEKQARESIALLKRLGLVKRDGKGYLRLTDKAIAAGPDIPEELLKQYQLKCLDAAQQSLIKNRSMHQVFSTNTISLSGPAYELLLKRLKQFKGEVRSLVNKDEHTADRVYQLAIQLFPHVKKENGHEQAD
jgi:uncharacterized protein (TIGR02147 family)